MASMLELQIQGAFNPAPAASDQKSQAEFAVDPDNFNYGASALGIIGVIAAMYAIIYLLHGVERWLDSDD